VSFLQHLINTGYEMKETCGWETSQILATWLLRIVIKQKKLGYKAHVSVASYTLLRETSTGKWCLDDELWNYFPLTTWEGTMPYDEVEAAEQDKL
jgi:hypothetical protein